MRTFFLLLMTISGSTLCLANDWAQLPVPIAGQSAGVSNGALIVAGGSSFDKPPWDGGIKQWSRKIYVFTSARAKPRAFELNQPLGYGCSVTWGESLIIAGGSHGPANDNRVRRLTWTGAELRQENLPALPVTLANCGAAVVGDTLYVFGGQEKPESQTASARLFALQLPNGRGGWQVLEPLPAAGRILPVVAALGADLYVFSGAALHPSREYLHDGWIYRAGKGWKRTTDTSQPIVAAPSISHGGRIWVFSGDNGELASRITELKDKHPGFSKSVMAFDPATGRWQHQGELPVSLVTTTACWWSRPGAGTDGYVLIPGGEDRPGHRSNRILLWRLPH